MEPKEIRIDRMHDSLYGHAIVNTFGFGTEAKLKTDEARHFVTGHFKY